MGLPLYLAMTAREMWAAEHQPPHRAWMACQFSPWGEGLANLPTQLEPGTMLILNDRMPCQGHSPDLAAKQLADAVSKFECESILLDFQQPRDEESEAMVSHLVRALPCPVAVSEIYGTQQDCPVFLSPAPLHVPLAEHLAPWKNREIWLEAALCQEEITVTPEGVSIAPQFPPDRLETGFFDETLCCHYATQINENAVHFTLFDTQESLSRKLEKAHSLGVTRAVGLYQELGKT